MFFDPIFKFEQRLAEYTGAPYAVMTDCCTHAIELCLRHEKPANLAFTAFTYLSVPMLMHKLNIDYRLIPEDWTGEYQFHGSRVWDSARRLEEGMYRPGTLQCLSFGATKPVDAGRGGAILLDSEEDYQRLSRMRYDGRDLAITPWIDQMTFDIGYHYRPTVEEAELALEKLEQFILNPEKPKYIQYPDCRKITFNKL